MVFRKKNVLGALLASAVFVSTSFAAVWKETNNKGLEVYKVGNGATGQITLVCDPDNLWAMDGNKQSTKFYLFTTLHNEQLAGPTITIKADGYNAAFPYEGGGSSQTAAGTSSLKQSRNPVRCQLQSGPKNSA